MSNSSKYLDLYDDKIIAESRDLFKNPLDNSSISAISKSKFCQHFHFLCKKCKCIPVLRFSINDKIKFICQCKESPRELTIKEIYNFLYFSENIELINFEIEEKLKCFIHPEEIYSMYCIECQRNLCSKCAIDCNNHKNKIIIFSFAHALQKKVQYIIEKINEKKNNFILEKNNTIDIEDNDDSFTFKNIPQIPQIVNENIDSKNNNTEKIILNDELEPFLIIKKIDLIKNNESKEEIINIINANNSYELHYDEEYYYINLFVIIIHDYQNYPNYYHFETISNIEKYITFSLGEYNEIDLKYEFNKRDIKNNFIELFGEEFVDKNIKNSFLVINEKLMDLRRFISLIDIYDDTNLLNDFPIHLDVKLLERKRSKMDDLSFMFFNIMTLLSSSNFRNFATINITKMKSLFSHCKSKKELPDISSFNTINVVDMSYMFYKCSSLKKLPDLSKWNVKNVVDVSHMFQNCKSLTSLPDISLWNTDNIKYLKEMFKNCEKLSVSPDLSKWNLSRDSNFDNIFSGCEQLEINNAILNYENKKILKCLKFSLNCIFDSLKYIFYLFLLIISGTILVIIHIFGFMVLISPLIIFYNSFNLIMQINIL